MLVALLLATVTTARAGLIDAIGRDVGLTRSQEVDEAHGARMLQDANDGRPDNLYFAALLHLYGKGGVSESPPAFFTLEDGTCDGAWNGREGWSARPEPTAL